MEETAAGQQRGSISSADHPLRQASAQDKKSAGTELWRVLRDLIAGFQSLPAAGIRVKYEAKALSSRALRGGRGRIFARCMDERIGASAARSIYPIMHPGWFVLGRDRSPQRSGGDRSAYWKVAESLEHPARANSRIGTAANKPDIPTHSWPFPAGPLGDRSLPALRALTYLSSTLQPQRAPPSCGLTDP